MECRGENREHFHCCNGKCPARVEANYTPHIAVRDGWYYARAYNLPFKTTDWSTDWYSISGPVCTAEGERSVLSRIGSQLYTGYDALGNAVCHYDPNTEVYSNLDGSPVIGVPILQWVLGWGCNRVLSMPYMALPTNDDLVPQLDILIDKFLSVEKPLPGCPMCGVHHNAEDDCEEADLMRGEAE